MNYFKSILAILHNRMELISLHFTLKSFLLLSVLALSLLPNTVIAQVTRSVQDREQQTIPQNLGGTALSLSEEQSRLIAEYKEYCNRPFYRKQLNDIDLLKKQIARCKGEKKSSTAIPIIIIVGFLIISIIIVQRLTSSRDPLKNLENLKDHQIITEEEFNKKIIEVEQDRNEKELRKKNEKLIQDLNKLKKGGIISESEFEEKLERIRSRKSSI